ncbi:alpha/beta fold hydrolase [Candidatus Parcubacteria bacterium]|jgi:carboxylesterase|nr:alpha/beta fold hydrolase [Candidatus Parcubacteria bacterium]MBT7228449.1 alpha/beta fold hydrolase [Candidatus Parcubacteria bacterium]
MVRLETRKEYVDLPGVPQLARPFKIKAKPRNNKVAILVHGFTSTPIVMRHLADYLAEQGIDVVTVLLAGHGRNLETFKRTKWQNWFDSVEDAVTENLRRYKHVYLVGHSMGANMCIHAAIKYPDVKAVVSLGASVYLRRDRWIRMLLPLAKIFNKKYRKRWIKKEYMDELNAHGRYTHIPIPSLVQLYDFIDFHTKREIKYLKCPILVLHSRKDEVSHPRSSYFIFKRLKVKERELFILDKNNHGLLHKTRRDFLFKKITNFIKKHK